MEGHDLLGNSNYQRIEMFAINFQEDIELMASLGFSAYRFSISWARIFPGMLNLTDKRFTYNCT